MLLSMTGYGDSRVANGNVILTTEIRAVNNRYFKFQCRLPELYSRFEPALEKLVRKVISRGTASLTLNRVLESAANSTTFDRSVIDGYLAAWQSLRNSNNHIPALTAHELLELPGVLIESETDLTATESEWEQIEQGVSLALEKFQLFRETEGRSMSDDLRSQTDLLENELAKVSERAPKIVSDYRTRILDRVNDLLKDSGVELQPSDVIREVSLFSDRCDINEEIVRLKSHLEQFRKFLTGSQSEGKRLDFLTQEMNREVNTIGSKANDVEVAHNVVEMKAAIEKIREVLQNVE